MHGKEDNCYEAVYIYDVYLFWGVVRLFCRDLLARVAWRGHVSVVVVVNVVARQDLVVGRGHDGYEVGVTPHLLERTLTPPHSNLTPLHGRLTFPDPDVDLCLSHVTCGPCLRESNRVERLLPGLIVCLGPSYINKFIPQM